MLAAIGLIASGIGILVGQPWWRTVLVGSILFSSIIFILLWDGVVHRLDNQGAIAILINAAILAALLIFHWPDFEF